MPTKLEGSKMGKTPEQVMTPSTGAFPIMKPPKQVILLYIIYSIFIYIIEPFGLNSYIKGETEVEKLGHFDVLEIYDKDLAILVISVLGFEEIM